jgi:hypothetical protein
VTPRDDTSTGRVVIGLEKSRTDLLRTGQDRLKDKLEREATRGVELVDNALGICGDLEKRPLTVEVLSASEKPDFRVRDVFHEFNEWVSG